MFCLLSILIILIRNVFSIVILDKSYVILSSNRILNFYLYLDEKCQEPIIEIINMGITEPLNCIIKKCQAEIKITDDSSLTKKVPVKLYDNNKLLTEQAINLVFSPEIEWFFPNVLSKTRINTFIAKFNTREYIGLFNFQCILNNLVSPAKIINDNEILCSFEETIPISNRSFFFIRIFYRETMLETEKEIISVVEDKRVSDVHPKILINQTKFNVLFEESENINNDNVNISLYIITSFKNLNDGYYNDTLILNFEANEYEADLERCGYNFKGNHIFFQIFIFYFDFTRLKFSKFSVDFIYNYIQYYPTAFQGRIFFFQQTFISPKQNQFFFSEARKVKLTFDILDAIKYETFLKGITKENFEVTAEITDQFSTSKKIDFVFEESTKEKVMNYEFSRELLPTEPVGVNNYSFKIFVSDSLLLSLTFISYPTPKITLLYPSDFVLNNKQTILINVYGENLLEDGEIKCVLSDRNLTRLIGNYYYQMNSHSLCEFQNTFPLHMNHTVYTLIIEEENQGPFLCDNCFINFHNVKIIGLIPNYLSKYSNNQIKLILNGNYLNNIIFYNKDKEINFSYLSENSNDNFVFNVKGGDELSFLVYNDFKMKINLIVPDISVNQYEIKNKKNLILYGDLREIENDVVKCQIGKSIGIYSLVEKGKYQCTFEEEIELLEDKVLTLSTKYSSEFKEDLSFKEEIFESYNFTYYEVIRSFENIMKKDFFSSSLFNYNSNGEIFVIANKTYSVIENYFQDVAVKLCQGTQKEESCRQENYFLYQNTEKNLTVMSFPDNPPEETEIKLVFYTIYDQILHEINLKKATKKVDGVSEDMIAQYSSSLKNKIIGFILKDNIKRQYSHYLYKIDKEKNTALFIVDYSDSFYSFLQAEKNIKIFFNLGEAYFPLLSFGKVELRKFYYNTLEFSFSPEDFLQSQILVEFGEEYFGISKGRYFSQKPEMSYTLSDESINCEKKINFGFTFNIYNILSDNLLCRFGDKVTTRVFTQSYNKYYCDIQKEVEDKIIATYCKSQAQIPFEIAYLTPFDQTIIKNSNGQSTTMLNIVHEEDPTRIDNYWPKIIFYDNTTSMFEEDRNVYLLLNSDQLLNEESFKYKCRKNENLLECQITIEFFHERITNQTSCITSLQYNIGDNLSISIQPIPLNDIYATITRNKYNASLIFYSSYDLNGYDIYCEIDGSFSKLNQLNQENNTYYCDGFNLFYQEEVSLVVFVENYKIAETLGKFKIYETTLESNKIKKTFEKNLFFDIVYEYSELLIIKGDFEQNFNHLGYVTSNGVSGECYYVNKSEIACYNFIPRSDFFVTEMNFTNLLKNNFFIVRKEKINDSFKIASSQIFSRKTSRELNSLIINFTNSCSLKFLSLIQLQISSSTFSCDVISDTTLLCNINEYFSKNQYKKLSKERVMFLIDSRISLDTEKELYFFNDEFSNVVEVLGTDNEYHSMTIKINGLTDVMSKELLSLRINNNPVPCEFIQISSEIFFSFIDKSIDINKEDSIGIFHDNVLLKSFMVKGKADDALLNKEICADVYNYLEGRIYESLKEDVQKDDMSLMKLSDERVFEYDYPLTNYNLTLFFTPEILHWDIYSSYLSGEFFNINIITLNDISYDFICSIYNSQLQYYYSSIAIDNVCSNLICINSRDTDLEFYAEIKYKNILLSKRKFLCKRNSYSSTLFPDNMFTTPNTSLISVNPLEKEQAKKLDIFLNHNLAKNSFDSVHFTNKTYEPLPNENIFVTRIIKSLSQTEVGNYYYDLYEEKFLTATVIGMAYDDETMISIKIQNEDGTLSQVVQCNITSKDHTKNEMQIVFKPPSNKNFKGIFYLLPGQYDGQFKKLDVTIDQSIIFREPPFLAEASPKLFNYKGGSDLSVTITNPDSISDLICLFTYGIGTKIESQLTAENKCKTPDFSQTTQKEKNFKLSLVSKANQFISSNIITLGLYKTSTVKYYFPKYFSYNTQLKLYVYFFEIEEYHQGAIKCITNDQEVNGAQIFSNQTIICNINELTDYTAINSDEKVLYTYNDGITQEDQNLIIHFYTNPTFNSIDITFDENAEYVISLDGTNIINAEEDLFCVFIQEHKKLILSSKAKVNSAGTQLTCSLQPCYNEEINSDSKLYNLYITYNRGEELIETGFHITIEYPPIVTKISPIIEVSEKETEIQFQVKNSNSVTNNKCQAFSELFDLINNNNDYKCVDVISQSSIDYSYSPIELVSQIDKGAKSYSNLVFHIIDLKVLSVSPLYVPVPGGTTITIKGKNLIYSNFFKIKLTDKNGNNENIISSYTYLNSTEISFQAPPLQSSVYKISYTVNEITYQETNFELTYHEPVNVLSISPSTGYGDVTNTIFIEGENIIKNKDLVCKADEYIIPCEYLETDTKKYCRITLPEFPYVKFGLLNPEKEDLETKITLSNNRQDFSTTYSIFQYQYFSSITQQKISYSPRLGPEEGGTLISFTSDSFDSFITDPYTIFGDFQVKCDYETKLIKCNSPPLSSINSAAVFQGSELNFVSIVLKLYFNQKEFDFTYVYNVNVTLNDFYPNNAEYSSSINIKMMGLSFYYYSALLCKFKSTQEEYIVNGISETFSSFYCPTPVITARTLTSMELTFTLNGVDFYSFKDVIVFFRDEEYLQAIMPSILPLAPQTGSKNSVTLLMSYYFDQSYKRSFCILSNNEDISKSTFTVMLKTENAVEPNQVACYIPSLKDINSNVYANNGILYIGASSNGITFHTPLQKIIFYSLPQITSISKIFFPVGHKFSFKIFGENFRDDIEPNIGVIQNGKQIKFFSGEYVSSTEISVVDAKLDECDSGINLSLYISYDANNFYTFKGSINCYYDHTVINTFPTNVIIREITEDITFIISDDIYLKANYKCVIDGIVTETKIEGSKIISCIGIQALSFDNPNVQNRETEISLLGNGEDLIIPAPLKMYIVNKASIDISGSMTINTYSMNQDTIIVKGSGFDISLKYYLKLDFFIIESSDVSSNQISFTREPIIKKQTYGLNISNNFKDWQETKKKLVVDSNLPCEQGQKCIETTINIYDLIPGTDCRPGYYCVNGIELLCPVGHFQSNKKRTSCIECPIGTLCYSVGMSIPTECPPGYLCKIRGIFSQYQLTPCPQGYYCPIGTNNFDLIDGRVNTAGYIQSCPNGSYCPTGTYQEVAQYNIDGHPQRCQDGVICAQNTDESKNNKLSTGGYNQYGLAKCPVGKYCKQGQSFTCSEGTECTELGLSESQKCIPGTYQDSSNPGSSPCNQCTVGSYCDQDGTIKPIYCTPGRICEFSGQHRASNYCPSGSYCTDSTIGYPTDKDSKTELTKKYYPRQCSIGQLCLGGVTQGITDENNPEAPQPCRAGLVCSSGDDSGLNLCPIGYYCPGNSAPIPAPPGHYVPGEGFIAPLECAPGYYTEQEAQAVCAKCPAGTFNSLQGQTSCDKCEPGSYRDDDMKSISCTLCPAGTYNPNKGSSKIKDCILCPEGYLCDMEGMIDYSTDGKKCPHGYICGQGTHSGNIKICKAGFYCSEGTSQEYQMHLCSWGYYCDEGSTPNNNKKNPCIQGWYCPYGSYMNEGGEIKITELLNEIMNLKRQYLPDDPDLEKISMTCSEDLKIPSEFISSYTSLKCPKGTTSDSGSECIGQCKKDPNSPASTVDPLHPEDYTKNYTIADDGNKESNNRLLDDDSSSVDKYILMLPYEIVYVTFDFQKVPEYLIFNEHYSISVIVDNEIQNIPYVSEDIFVMPESNVIRFKIFNYSQKEITVVIRIFIHNGLFLTLSDSFLQTANITKYLPYRSAKGTNKLFPFILLKSTFLELSLSLPYNMIFEQEQTPLMSYFPLETSFLYSHDFHEKDPFLVQDFENEGLFVPWIPFLSNCNGYDQRIVLYDLVENSGSCGFPDADSIVIVKSFPIKGLSPVSDECDVKLKCQYDESDQSVISNKWFALIDETILMYITAKPININEITEENINSILESSTDSSGELNSKNYIPIRFIPERNGVNNHNCFPQNVRVEIQYYQHNINEKKIVDFIVKMSNYSVCKNISSTDAVSPEYDVEILYYPLNYFELLNYFQFSYPSYFLLILLIGCILTFIILVGWGVTSMVSKNKDAESLQMEVFFNYFLFPTLKPTFYGIVISGILVGYSYGLELSNTFSQYSLTWNKVDNEGFAGEYEKDLANNSRVSVYFLFISFYLFYGSLQKICPLPPKKEAIKIEKTRIFDSHLTNKSGIKKELEEDDEDSTMEIEPKHPIEKVDEEVEVEIVIGWKQKMVLVKYLTGMFYIVLKMEFVESTIYHEHIIGCVLVLNLIDAILGEVCLKYLFTEALLAVPLLAIGQVGRFLTLVGTNNFKEALICHCLTLIENCLIRIYIYPYMDTIEYLVKVKLIMVCIKKKDNFFFKWLYLTFLKETNENFEDDLDLEIKKEQYLKKKKKVTIEPILRSMTYFSVSVISATITPLTIILFLLFESESKAFQTSQATSGNLIYYLIFSVALIIPDLAIEMILSNYIEVLHGFRIQEYVIYCNYRYSIRSSKWIDMRDTMDIGINSFWRSLDAMLFSEQFYFFCFLTTMSFVFLLISIKIALRNEYNVFDDPTIIIFILLFIASYIVIYFLGKFVDHFGGLFPYKKFKLNAREGKFLDFVKVDSNMKDISKLMTTELFRQKFVSVNKSWLISNLEYILGLNDDFDEGDEKIDAKLEHLYQQAINYEAIDKEIQNKKELIKRDLQLMPYNQPAVGEVNNEYGVRLDISKDSIIDEPNDIELGKPNMSVIEKPYFKIMCQIWRNKAREIIRYKTWCIDILEDARLTYCEKCNSKFELQVFQDIELSKLINEFKNEHAGEVINMSLWQNFYAKKQKFVTLCMECAYLRNTKFYEIQARKEQDAFEPQRPDAAKIKAGLEKKTSRGILFMWLFEARTKILMDRMKGLEDEKEEEIKREKEKKKSLESSTPKSVSLGKSQSSSKISSPKSRSSNNSKSMNHSKSIPESPNSPPSDQ